MGAYTFALFNFFFFTKAHNTNKGGKQLFQYRCRCIAADTYAQIVHNDEIKVQ